MTKFIIVTHGDYGKHLVKSAELIVGKQENVSTLGLDLSNNVDHLFDRLNQEICNGLCTGSVVVFSDIFGGSPMNVTVRNLKNLSFHSITGVNMPMLLEAFSLRDQVPVDDLVSQIFDAGTKGIVNVNDKFGLKGGK